MSFRVRTGEQLMDGPSNPHDILRVLGEKELQKYLVNEIQGCRASTSTTSTSRSSSAR